MDGTHLNNKIGIVGGGITGLISAYFLSLEGYKVDLYEKKTLLSETSSKTTKLIHGGIRYLENLQFHEVKNGINDRKWWLENFPDETKLQEIIILSKKKLSPEIFKFFFGIKVYELTESCSHIMDKDKASLGDMYNDLLNLGKIFGVEDRAKTLVASYKLELKNFEEDLKNIDQGLRVFVYDSGEDAPFTAGRYAMPTALIEAAGGQNIMDDFNKSWGTVTWEEVVDRDPQVVVIVNYGDVTAEQKREYMMSNPAFKNISAVKNNRFVTLEYVEATPGPRNIQAIKHLADAFWTK